jgi:hypothetical protein
MIGMEEMKQSSTAGKGMWEWKRKYEQKRERPGRKEKGTGKGQARGAEKGEKGKRNRIKNILCSGGNKNKKRGKRK